MGFRGPEPWRLDARVVERVAMLEAQLAELYDELARTVPDRATAMLLERLASASRRRAGLFRLSFQGAAPPEDLLQRWIDAQNRFERAAAEAADLADAELRDFQREVARVGRELDVLLLAGGRELRG